MDLDIEINELQGKVLLGDVKIQEKLLHKMERKAELLRKKDEASAENGANGSNKSQSSGNIGMCLCRPPQPNGV